MADRTLYTPPNNNSFCGIAAQKGCIEQASCTLECTDDDNDRKPKKKSTPKKKEADDRNEAVESTVEELKQ